MNPMKNREKMIEVCSDFCLNITKKEEQFVHGLFN